MRNKMAGDALNKDDKKSKYSKDILAMALKMAEDSDEKTEKHGKVDKKEDKKENEKDDQQIEMYIDSTFQIEYDIIDN